MTVTSLSRWIITLIDILAVSTVINTGEVTFWAWGTLGALLILNVMGSSIPRYSTHGLLPDRVVLVLLALGIVLAGCEIWLKKWHPLIAVANAVPFLHVILATAQLNYRNRSLRLGMGFVEIVISAAISPDLYLAPAIFGYMVLTSLTLSSLFLESELSTHDPAKLKEPLSRSFFSYAIGLSIVVFLASALIFPLLPRPRGSSSSSGIWNPPRDAQIGYTEEVVLSDINSWISTSSGNSVLKVYPVGENSVDVGFLFPPGELFKGRTLDRFDGVRWVAAIDPHQRQRTSGIVAKSGSRLIYDWSAEIVREPISSASLLFPYSAAAMEVKWEEGWMAPYLSVRGDWTLPALQGKRATYRIHGLSGISNKNEPWKVHLEVPSLWSQDSKWKILAANVFAGAKTNREKISKAYQYFIKNNYEAEYAQIAPGEERTSSPHPAKTAMDTFLFGTKKGHCELFASSMALLLRMGGVPSRLVAGLRVQKHPVGGVLNLRDQDAHAWLEAWDPQWGWRVLDPTPMIVSTTTSFSDLFHALQDWTDAYWHQYIIKFNGEDQKNLGKELIKDFKEGAEFWTGKKTPNSSETGAGSKVGPAIFGFVFLLVALLLSWVAITALRLLIYGNTRGEDSSERARQRDLIAQRRKMARILKTHQFHSMDQALAKLGAKGCERSTPAAALLKWRDLDERARFGRFPPSSREWRKLIHKLEIQSKKIQDKLKQQSFEKLSA